MDRGLAAGELPQLALRIAKTNDTDKALVGVVKRGVVIVVCLLCVVLWCVWCMAYASDSKEGRAHGLSCCLLGERGNTRHNSNTRTHTGTQGHKGHGT